MGRAGSGGYATVQHAYDTRLKRDVAIKCIKISPSDLERSRARANITIHDAQVINASMPLSELGGARASARPSHGGGLVSGDVLEGGFVPLTAKINEPSFLSSRERHDEKRASRHEFLRKQKERQRQERAYGRTRAGSAVVGYGGVNPIVGGISDGVSMDLSDFDGYSKFRSIGSALAGAGNTRRVPGKGESFTIGLSEFAGGIPGKIAGVGEAAIAAVDDAVVVEVQPSQDHPTAELEASARTGAVMGGAAQGGVAASAAAQAASAAGTRLATSAQAPSGYQDALTDSGKIDLALLDHIPGLEEARTAAHLNDASIVTVYDCVVEGDTCYVIMEYVEGKTLARIMREIDNDITLDMIAAVFASVSHALEVAHKAGVLHLDVKPENVIINREGVIKVTDFGLSTLMDASGQGVTGGGTIGYMPLEQMRQQRLDVRTDEWALASLTYEMLSGKNPFKARTLRDAEAAIEGAELVIPSLCWENIDEAVDNVMFDALSPDMDGRYPDIKSFSGELTPILGDAKDGARQLAEVVKGPDLLAASPRTANERERKAPKPYVPFIDKLGMKGSSIVMRVVAALGTAMMAVIALLNFRVDLVGSGADGGVANGADTTFGLFSNVPLAAAIILAALIAFAVWRPRWSFPATVGVFVVMLMFSQAWLVALLLAAGAGAWWWFFGRTNDMMCSLVLMQPLVGSVGFTAVVPILAGALLDIRDALATSGMVALGAIAFASLGSDDVMNWNIMANFIVALNPSIAGASISNGLFETLSSLENWCVMAGWIAGAVAYAFLCRRGTHVFDIVGSVLGAVCVVAGTIVVPIVTNDYAVLTPLTISGIVTASLVGVMFALLHVTDRVRMAPGEW